MLNTEIGFADDAEASLASVLNHLTEFVVDLEMWSSPRDTQHAVVITQVHDDAFVVVCPTNGPDNAPVREAAEEIDIAAIRRVVVL